MKALAVEVLASAPQGWLTSAPRGWLTSARGLVPRLHASVLAVEVVKLMPRPLEVRLMPRLLVERLMPRLL